MNDFYADSYRRTILYMSRVKNDIIELENKWNDMQQDELMIQANKMKRLRNYILRGVNDEAIKRISLN